jgi:hypothetical protein
MAESFTSALAQGLKGYLQGLQIQQDRDEHLEDRRAREEDRAFVRGERLRAVDERAKLAEAGAPVIDGGGGVVRSTSADDRDVGQVDGPTLANGGLMKGTAAQANTGDGIQARQVSVLRALGKPMEAQQLETAGVQGKAAKFTLDREQEKFLNEKVDQSILAAGTADQLAKVLSNDTMQVSVMVGKDGKKQLMRAGPDGQQVAFGSPLDDSTPQKFLESVQPHLKSLDVAHKVQFAQQAAQFAEQQRQFNENKAMQQDHFGKTFGLQTEQFGEAKRHARVSEGLQGAALKQQAADRAEARAERVDARSERAEQWNAQHKLSLEKWEYEKGKDPLAKLPATAAAQVKLNMGTVEKIDAAMTKAMADNSWDPKGENAKALMDQRDNAILAINRTMAAHDAGKVPPGTAQVPGSGQAQARSILTQGAKKQEPGSSPAKAEPTSTAGKIMDFVRNALPTAVTAPATPTPSKAAPAAQPTATPQIENAGSQVDAMRATATAATQELQKWGLVQRKKDPAGYAQAVARAEAAKEGLSRVEKEYAGAVGGLGASFRAPAP